MTKPRDPLSFASAIKDVVDLIRMPEACRITGRAVRTIQHWCEGDRKGTPTLDQALALDKAFIAAGGGKAPITDCFLRQMEIFRAASDACRMQLAQDVADLSKEAGEAVSHCIAALQPGSTPIVIRNAIAETEHVDALLPRLIGRLKALHPGNGAGREAYGESK